MTRDRDSQKARLYRAEKPIQGTERMSLDDCRAYVRRVEKSALWRSFYRGSTVEVTDGRGSRNARALFNEIKLPQSMRKPAVVLHELAHVANENGNASHGPEFATIFLALVRRFMGVEAATVLLESMRKHRVRRAKLKEVNL